MKDIPSLIDADVEAALEHLDVEMQLIHWKSEAKWQKEHCRIVYSHKDWADRIGSLMYYVGILLGFYLGYLYCLSLPKNETLREYVLIVVFAILVFCCYRLVRVLWRGPISEGSSVVEQAAYNR